jgi:hypothetical protein
LTDIVLTVSAIPYGRPSDLSVGGVLEGWRGTCSTKHLLLLALLDHRWPDLAPVLIHRVHTVEVSDALEAWGPVVAASIPAEGLVDVHTFMTATISGQATTIEVTFPVDRWDGRSSLPIWAASGGDVVAGPDPLASKANLVAAWCDPRAREPFIAALSTTYGSHRPATG